MSSKEIEWLLTNKIIKKLPKKYRKKLRWEKLGPVLAAVISMAMQLLSTFSERNSRQKTGHKPSSASAPPKRQTETIPKPDKQAASSPAIRNSDLQAHLERAQAYRVEINQLVQQAPNTAQGDRLRDLATHIDDWVSAIGALVRRIDDFQQNRLIQQDLKTVPQAIDSLEKQLVREDDPLLRSELERTLSSRRQQQQSLGQMQRTMQWTELKIESTLSRLGTIYSQVLTGQSKDQVTNYRRLLDQVDEEVYSLQDYLTALEEVKMGSSLSL